MAKNNSEEPKRPRGRPPQGGPTPIMQLGRVKLEDKETLHAAAKRAGKSFTEWSLDILLRAARKK